MGNISEVVKKVANNYQKDPTKMLDVIRDTQAELGQVSDEAIKAIAKEMNVSTVDVEGVVTFYHFFSKKPVGKYAVYLNNSGSATFIYAIFIRSPLIICILLVSCNLVNHEHVYCYTITHIPQALF